MPHPSSPPVFRFAPSPNGYLHLGHAYSALLNAQMARAAGGRLLVRLEDIDTTRCTDALAEACLEDLAWLGLEWEAPVLRQSTQFSRYQAVAAGLEGRGLLYPCFCTRGEIARAAGDNAAQDPDGALRYPGTCRALSREERAERMASGAPHALRLDLNKAERTLFYQSVHKESSPFDSAALCVDSSRSCLDSSWAELETGRAAFDPRQWGDVILLRKDVPAGYHLAVVLDDAMQGVTHVVRGRDLYAATAIHRVLQTLLDLPEPVYHHHPLLIGEDGRKLAKSALSTPLRQLRAEGVRAAEIRARLGFI